jgi:hypothetical protein
LSGKITTGKDPHGIRKLDWEGDIPPSQHAVPTVRVTTTARVPPVPPVYMTGDLDRVGESKQGQQPPYNNNRIERLVLPNHKCNASSPNKKLSTQVSGIAMGTNLTPSYANILMGKLEWKLLYNQ